MKRLLLLLSFSLVLSAGSSQITEDDFDLPSLARVQAQRVAYITQRLGLTPEESSQFWATVNEYENKQREIKKKYQPSKAIQLMNDAEAEAYINNTFLRDEELLRLKKTYFERFKSILPPSKIALFPKAENEFKRVVLQQLRQNFQRRRN